MLARSGLANEAGLVRDAIESFNVQWPSYEHDYLWAFLGVPRIVPAVTPEQLNFPKSLWAKNLGVFFARTGFGSNGADGVFSITDGHYRFAGHAGPDDWPGFSLAKFGTLVNTRNVAHRGYGNLNDYPGGYPFNIVYFDGGHTLDTESIDEPAELQSAAQNQASYDHGGMEQVTRKDGAFYHVRVDRDRRFDQGVSHTREYLWLPGSEPAKDSDFLVVYDRTQAPTHPQWLYHVPWKPTATGYSSTENISTGGGQNDRIGEAYTGGNVIIKEVNSLGGERDNDGGTQNYTGGGVAHGVAFCKTLLPDEARVEVTRVASFDSDVIKRQHHLAIKSHRWQVAVKPTKSQSSHRFLHLFQTADAQLKSLMSSSALIDEGVMQGVWIERESPKHSNYVVLFHKHDGVNHDSFVYTVTGEGTVRHVITGVKPNTLYRVEDLSSGSAISVATEHDVALWDYKGTEVNDEIGVLYFETSTSGTHAFMVSATDAPPFEQGDLNGDGSVDVLDLQIMVNVLLGIDAAVPAADMNGNGAVDVLDLQMLVNTVLGG
jgi:hypothetical protein